MKDLECSEIEPALKAIEGHRIKSVEGVNIFDSGLYGLTLRFDDGSFIRFEATALVGMDAVIAVGTED